MSLLVDDFTENVAKKISDLTAHSFISKSQSQYLKRRKELLGKNEAIILLVCAENYQFVIQDEIQSFHRSKEYCTCSMSRLALHQAAMPNIFLSFFYFFLLVCFRRLCTSFPPWCVILVFTMCIRVLLLYASKITHTYFYFFIRAR